MIRYNPLPASVSAYDKNDREQQRCCCIIILLIIIHIVLYVLCIKNKDFFLHW